MHQLMNQNRAARMEGTLRAAFGMLREMVSEPICPGIEVYSVPHPGTPYRFKDEASQTQIDLGGGVDPYTQVALEPQRVHFGGAGDDSFSGRAKADNLVGGVINDVLMRDAMNDGKYEGERRVA